MSLFGTAAKVARVGRGWVRRFSQGGLVLCYHRVVDTPTDPQTLTVSPANFDQQMDVLSRSWQVMPLQRMVWHLRERRELPDRTAVVTFDDGYVDNLECARPILAKYDIPATAFVTTGGTGGDRDFWWDELERIFLRPGALPSTLSLTLAGESRQWELGKSSQYGYAEFERHRRWTVYDSPDPTVRHAIYRAICAALRSTGITVRNSVLNQLRTWSGIDEAPLYPACTRSEIVRLAADGLVEIGAHTVTHSQLSVLSPEEQKAEITGSRQLLEEITGSAVRSFSYPFGARNDYTPETVRLLGEAGYTAACSIRNHHVRRYTSPLEIPRNFAPNYDGDRFSALMEHWFRDTPPPPPTPA